MWREWYMVYNIHTNIQHNKLPYLTLNTDSQFIRFYLFQLSPLVPWTVISQTVASSVERKLQKYKISSNIKGQKLALKSRFIMLRELQQKNK